MLLYCQLICSSISFMFLLGCFLTSIYLEGFVVLSIFTLFGSFEQVLSRFWYFFSLIVPTIKGNKPCKMRKSKQQSQQHISKHKVFLVRIIWLRCLESREASTVTHKTVLCGGKLWGSKVPRRFFVRQMQAIYGHVLRTPPFKELCHTGRILFTRKTEFMVLLCIKGVLKKVLKLINSVLAYFQIFLVATSFYFSLN